MDAVRGEPKRQPQLIRSPAVLYWFVESFASPLSSLSHFSRGGAVRLPQRFGYSGLVARPAAPHEQRIPKPVQIFYSFGGRLLLARQRHHSALGATAHGPAHMQLGIQTAPARQHE